MANPNLTIRKENVTLYELESNDRFDPDRLPEEEQRKIEEANEKFEDTVLQNNLLQKAFPCQCMGPKLQERAMRRASILAPSHAGPGPMSINLQIEQEDIDQKDFVVVVNEDDGYYTDIRMVISHCKNCGELHMWGEVGPIGELIARAFVDHDTTKAHKDRRTAQLQQIIDDGPVPPEGTPMFVMENTETGEITPADDLVNGMLGKGPMPKDMFTESVDEFTEEAPAENTTPSGIILPD